MISAIACDGAVYINVHMEQVYTDYIFRCEHKDKQLNIKEDCCTNYSTDYMKTSCLTFKTVEKIEEYIKAHEDRDIVLDFQDNLLRSMQNNIETKLLSVVSNKKNIYILNLSKEYGECLSKVSKVPSKKISSYYDVFNRVKYELVRKIRENNEYECANGVILSKYINVKKIVEDNNMFFMWSYILCRNLINNGRFTSLCKSNSHKPILLAHTLNGVCIATMISKLMDLRMLYIDHLGPHNRITGINFPQNYDADRNYLVVVDFVCQGNELLRAQNIVEFIGGKYVGFLSVRRQIVGDDNCILNSAVMPL